MPRTKSKTIKASSVKIKNTKKESPVNEEEKIIDPDLILGDEIIVDEILEKEEEDDDDDALLTEDEIDPFKDRWEE
jgi:hypothetical protein